MQATETWRSARYPSTPRPLLARVTTLLCPDGRPHQDCRAEGFPSGAPAVVSTLNSTPTTKRGADTCFAHHGKTSSADDWTALSNATAVTPEREAGMPADDPTTATITNSLPPYLTFMPFIAPSQGLAPLGAWIDSDETSGI